MHRLTPFLAAFSSLVIFGVVLALPGTALGLPDVRQALGIGLAQQGQMILLVFAGLGAATLVVGPLVDRFGTTRVLSASTILVGGALLLFAAARGAVTVALAMLALGVGGAGINTAANVLVSGQYPEERGRMLNRVALGASVGGLSLPLLAALTYGRLPIRELTAALGALAFATGVWMATLQSAPRPRPSTDRTRVWDVARRPGLWLIGLVLLLESANENITAGWASTYAQSQGLSPASSTWVLAWHWTALCIGRAALSGVVDRVGHRRVAVVCAVCAATSAAIFIVVATPAGVVFGAILLGLSFSLVFPTVLAIAGQRYRSNAGVVFGCLLAGAQIGGIVFPPLIGAIAEQTTVRTGMIVLVGTTTALVALIVPATRRRNAEA